MGYPGVSGAAGPSPMKTSTDKPHIRVVTPIYEDTCAEHKLALKDMEVNANGYTFDYVVVRSANAGMGRNYGVTMGQSSLKKQELDKSISHYLFIDGDIHWNPGDVEDLLKLDAPVASGAYQSRENAECFQAGLWGVCPGDPGQLVNIQSQGPHRVKWAGGGFLLVKREILEALPHPWFRHTVIDYREPLPGPPYQAEHSFETNEDVGFSVLCEQHGVDIVLHCDVQLTHMLKRPPVEITVPADKFHLPEGLTHIPMAQWGGINTPADV